jgi:glycosyltransferase involved in cell wall biosynthesis
LGSAPAPERIFFTTLWFRGHNNPRYEELLPRLKRLDVYLVVLSNRGIVRGIEYRTLRAIRHARDPLVFAAANRRYQRMLTANTEQIPYFNGAVVADVDDPQYTEREVAALNRANVAAYVVTAEKAARQFESLGVEKPWYVIPQGISLRSVDEAEVARLRRSRRPDEVIVGYMAAWLLSRGDRDGDNPLYGVDHLLDLWDEIHARAPESRLWLVGGASKRVRGRCAGRPDIFVAGRLARPQALAHVANFDVALYAREKDQGIRAAKVAEYMGMGVPTVAYDFEVTEDLRERGAGVLVKSRRAFVEAVVSLVRNPSERAPLAEAARRAGAELDWDGLARRYEELLDLHLGP